MSHTQMSGVRIAGISSAVPQTVHSLDEYAPVFGADEVAKISDSTGVVRRHIAPDHVCASDLCFAAAQRLMSDLMWTPDSIDALVFVSQTPDYRLPPTSCVLQSRLGIPQTCAAFDINLGCSGYVYGLWVASGLVAAGGAKRVLLLVGDTINRVVSGEDRATALLFGDAGTATAVERNVDAPSMWFVLGTDGSGAGNLIIPAGGFRKPATESTAARSQCEDGNVRSDNDLFMDGAEVFAFTLRVVPGLVRETLQLAGWALDDVDYCVMHQANRFIIDYLAKRMKLPSAKVVRSIAGFGNTSSASIPLTITHSLAPELRQSDKRLLLVGFGVGYSWGALAIQCGHLVAPPMVLLNSSATLDD